MQQQEVEGGWITAEYSMPPYSTLDRKRRDVSRGKQDGRSTEIQRLIGRARSALDLKKIGSRTIWIDRCASGRWRHTHGIHYRCLRSLESCNQSVN